MTKGLRKRFIVFAMAVVTVLLLILVAVINGIHWVVLDGQSDAALRAFAGAGERPMQAEHPSQPPRLFPANAAAMKENAFFVVHMGADGTVLDVNTDRMTSVSAEQAESYAARATGGSGKIDSFKYEVRETREGRLIFFVDTSGQTETFLMVLLVSVVSVSACWLGVLLFVVLLSGKVVRPIIAGMEKQKQFITNAGHELKTPLAIIRSNNDAMMLIHGENKYNSNIRQQTQRLNTLMDNLLTLSRLEEGMRLPTETVNISELVGSLLPAYRDAAQDRRIEFSAAVTPEICLQTNRDSFAQMIVVLLDNALKYTRDGGEIRITLSREKNRVRFVEENSCEMERGRDPERLFERFYRGDDARTQKNTTSGYGIGLSAARAIAETFGGTLTAECPSDGRIRFTARF